MDRLGRRGLESQTLASPGPASSRSSGPAERHTESAAGKPDSGILTIPGVLLAVFAVSGFAGLIYESIWSHYLRLFLGHASYAQTLVLVIFMGGMAVGSALTSRYCSRWRNLLLVYAVVEGAIGLFGLFFHAYFDQVTALVYGSVFPLLDSSLAIQAVKWSMAAGLIASQSILLGMTFPLISGALVRRFPDSVGSSVAMLYFTNSLGAAIGVLVSGFVLISWVGLPGTIMTAGLLSVLLALIVWIMSRRPQWQPAQPTVETDRPTGGALPGLWTPLLAAALITGAASFMYEVAWIRMLSHVLGSSTHAFELILSAFIFGLAFGSLWIRRRIEKLADPLGTLGMIQIAMGILALATILSFSQSFDVMSYAFGKLHGTASGYGTFNLVSHAIAFAVMLPATFCAGMTLPLVTHALIGNGFGEKSIGAVYAANTVGAIIGVVVAVQLAMPALGLKGLVVLGAGLDLGLGLYILLFVARVSVARRALPAGALGVVTLLATFLFVRLDPNSMASAVYQHGSARALPGVEFPFHKDGKTATVDLLSYPVGVIAITTNGKTDATINMTADSEATTDEVTMVLLGAIPLAARPDAENAAVIGFGSGLTTHVLLGSDAMSSVDTIEIEAAMIEASEWFRPRVERAYSDSRSHVHIDDARAFFSTRPDRYDIIISEPSHPWVSGVSNLYSSEFYAIVKSRLSDRGVFAQWLHMSKTNPVLVASVIGALSSQFSEFAVYNTNGRDILILAADSGGLALHPERLFETPNIADDLATIGVRHEQDLSARRMGGARLIRSYYGSFSAVSNSDFFPVLDLNAFRAQFLGHSATELFSLRNGPLPVIEMLDARRSRPDSTLVSNGSTVRSLRSTHDATLLRDYYGGRIDLDGAGLPEALRDAVLATEILVRNCGVDLDSELLITHINAVAGRLASFLDPGELAAIWQRFEDVACTKSWSPHLRSWFALHRAVSARDAPRMAAISTDLLESGRDTHDADRLRYLVAAKMLGHLADGDKRSALEAWSTYGSSGLANGRYRATMRLLIAYSQP